MYLHICICKCLHVYRKYVHVYLEKDVHTHIRAYVCTSACGPHIVLPAHLPPGAFKGARRAASGRVRMHSLHVRMRACTYKCMYIYIYI